MSTGTGLPTPRCFDTVVVNGSDFEVVITPPPGEYVVYYSSAGKLNGSTDYHILCGGFVVIDAELVGGNPDVQRVLLPQAFPVGAAVTFRAVGGTTPDKLLISAGIAR